MIIIIIIIIIVIVVIIVVHFTSLRLSSFTQHKINVQFKTLPEHFPHFLFLAPFPVHLSYPSYILDFLPSSLCPFLPPLLLSFLLLKDLKCWLVDVFPVNVRLLPAPTDGGSVICCRTSVSGPEEILAAGGSGVGRWRRINAPHRRVEVWSPGKSQVCFCVTVRVVQPAASSHRAAWLPLRK